MYKYADVQERKKLLLKLKKICNQKKEKKQKKVKVRTVRKVRKRKPNSKIKF